MQNINKNNYREKIQIITQFRIYPPPHAECWYLNHAGLLYKINLSSGLFVWCWLVWDLGCVEISVVETLDCDLTLYVVLLSSQHCETFISLNDILHTGCDYILYTSSWHTQATSLSVCPTYAVQLKLQPANRSLYEEVREEDNDNKHGIVLIWMILMYL